jgi:deazaflavin-dependent oxidoreductase (nitroreductase family)
MATTNRSHETSVGTAGAEPAPTRRARPRRPTLLAWFFRIPVFLYRVGLAEQLGRSTLLLTTRGRRTGRWRTTALNYLTEGDVTYVLAGMGPGSDWLRNLQADPHVQVQVGRRRVAARAETIVDPAEHRRVLCLWAEQTLRTAPPPAAQGFMRRLGFDYNASVRRHLEEDPPPPIVALRPVPRASETCSGGE